MPDYRLYALNPENRIQSATDLQAPTDEAAVAQAAAAVLGDWELWSGRRLVKRAEGGVRTGAHADGKDQSAG